MPVDKEPVSELTLASYRNNILKAYIAMLQEAFVAYKEWAVDYQTLPQYLDDDVLDEANKLPLQYGHALMLTWVETVRHAIAAGVRRAQFKRIK